MLKYRFSILLTLITLYTNLLGQTRQHPWSIGIHIGKTENNGDLGDASFDWSKAFYINGGIRLERYVSPSFDFTAQLNAGELGYWRSKDSITYLNGRYLGNFYGNHYNGFLGLRYKFNNGYILKENARIAPFLFIGLGISHLYGPRIWDYFLQKNTSYSAGFAHDMIFPSGIGINVAIDKKERWKAYWQTAFSYTDHDSRDGITIRNNDGFMQHQIGVSYNFGKAVKNSDSSFIRTIYIIQNIDRDSDGIVDQLDACPDTPGTLMSRGCPDRDFDGIADKFDKCPDVPGMVKYQGCPDTDGDGIMDADDSCVTVPGLKQFNGCPDTDGDGIPDNQDSCKTVPGLSRYFGCPDSDNDSLPDHLDKCPREAGPAWNKGCPEIKESVRKLFERALTGIQFQTNKAIILPKSFPILDNVAKVMKENPTYYLIINGHTDDQGDDMKNMKLSDDRANAVRLYLIRKGVSAERMESHGFGETQPIDSNETPEGRSRNRRVEFKVKFEDKVEKPASN